MGFEVEKYGWKGGHRIYKIYKGWLGENYSWALPQPPAKSNFFKSPPSYRAILPTNQAQISAITNIFSIAYNWYYVK